MDSLKIEKVLVYDLSLALKRPFYVHNVAITARDMLIVQVITDKGMIGFGEAAPLPGVSREPLKKARHQLDLLAEDWSGREVPALGPDLIYYCQRALDKNLVCASVKFALESALLMAVSRTLGTAPCNILMNGSAKGVQSAGLLQGSLAETVEQAKAQKAQGISVFKLKVGNRNVALDIRKVEEIKSVIGPSATLRLDANGSWRFDEALLFAQNIGKNQIDYFEEPCAQIEKWEDLYRKTDIPLAADESLSRFDPSDLAGLHGLTCFVVKPTVYGGVTGFWSLHEMAKVHAKRVVVSSAFESGIGTVMLANLAAISGEVAGLGSFGWLAEDALRTPLFTPSGLVTGPRLNLAPEDLFEPLRDQLVTC